MKDRTEKPMFAKFALGTPIAILALVGLYTTVFGLQKAATRAKVVKIESTRSYDKDLGWNLPNGKPIYLVDPANDTTLVFFDGFRGQIGAGLYYDWFKELHGQGVNVVSPIIGLQGWSFDRRNREWRHEEDMRQALQIYDAYVANLPAGHKVYVASMSYGALANATVAVFGSRRPDGLIFIAPDNKGLSYRSQSKLVAWLSTQTSWLRHILPFNMRSKNPARATLWDIVNDDLSRDLLARFGQGVINPEENVSQGYEVNLTGPYLEDRLLPRVGAIDALVVVGDSDLYFTQEGFASFASKLAEGGGKVERLVLPETGHIVLLDNGGPAAKAAIKAFMGR